MSSRNSPSETIITPLSSADKRSLRVICNTKRGNNAVSNIRLPYGEAADGRLLHISAVPSGLVCACKCPACGVSLVARKGRQLEHHFAHHSSVACAKALESALHKLAKQLIADHRKVGLPKVEAVVGDKCRLVRPAQIFDDIDVTLEKGMDGLRPDIVARKANHELLVEVAVTHFCDPRKIALIRERKLAAIEINLHNIRLDLPAADLEAAILFSAPRYWLYNRRLDKAEAELIQERDEREREELARKERDVRVMAERFVWAWRSVPRDDEMARLTAVVAEKQQDLADAEMVWAIDLLTGGDGGFRVRRKVWQAVILHHVIHPGWADAPVSADDMLGLLKKAHLIKEPLSDFVSTGVAEAARLIQPEFMSPNEAILEYLAALEEKGILNLRGDVGREYWITERTVVRNCAIAIRNAQERRHRIESVRRAARMLQSNIHTATGGDSLPVIDVDWWMHTRHQGFDVTPEVLATHGQSQTDKLLAHLHRLSAMILGTGLVEENLLGLPLGMFRERRQQAIAEENHRLAEERRVADEAASERKRLRAKEARDSLIANARKGMGEQYGRHFIATPLECLEERALLEMEGVTPEQEDAVYSLLKTEIVHLEASLKRQRRMADYLYRLKGAAVAIYGEVRAKLWMGATHPGLSGKRPQEVAVDESGLERCLKLLRPIGGRKR